MRRGFHFSVSPFSISQNGQEPCQEVADMQVKVEQFRLHLNASYVASAGTAPLEMSNVIVVISFCSYKPISKFSKIALAYQLPRRCVCKTILYSRRDELSNHFNSFVFPKPFLFDVTE